MSPPPYASSDERPHPPTSGIVLPPSQNRPHRTEPRATERADRADRADRPDRPERAERDGGADERKFRQRRLAEDTIGGSACDEPEVARTEAESATRTRGPPDIRPYLLAELPTYDDLDEGLTSQSKPLERGELLEMCKEHVGALLQRLGGPGALNKMAFRGRPPIPPKFSYPVRHQIERADIPHSHLLEITVILEGIWQLGRPHNRFGPIFGKNLLVPFFGLPGADKRPNAEADRVRIGRLTWQLSSRTGVDVGARQHDAALSPFKTTWTLTLPKDQVLIVHFSLSDPHEPVKRYHALLPGEAFAIGHRGTRQGRGPVRDL